MTHDDYYENWEVVDPAKLLPKVYDLELSTVEPSNEPLEDLGGYTE